MPKLPTDTDVFEIVQSDPDLAYVDKTIQIAQMLSTNRHMLFTRPRRFGKTLMLSTVEALFQGKRELFADTWIGQGHHWDWSQTYAVVRLDMSESTAMDLSELKVQLQDMVQRAAHEHELELDDSLPPSTMLIHLLTALQRHQNRHVVVLIDEYDAPVNQTIAKGGHDDRMTLLREFFRTLKSRNRLLRATLVTGITRFARAGLWSGMNHLRDVSLRPDLATLCGFTQTELHEHPIICSIMQGGAKMLGCSPDEMYIALEDHYNGYRFTHGPETVYNPYSLACCLEDMTTNNLPDWPELPNYWVESGTSGLLLDFLQQPRYALRDPFTRKPAEVERAVFDMAHPHPDVLMYQSGYLTRVAGPDGDRLDFPNREVENAFRQELTEWQQDRIAVLSQGHSELAEALRNALLQNDPQGVQGAFNNYLRAITPDLHLHYWRPRRKSKDKEITDYEKHYHALLLGLCLSLPQAMRVTAEEASGTGRLDMAFDMGGHVVVLELKINREGHTALTQALTRDYGFGYARLGCPVTVLGLNIDSHSYRITDCKAWHLGLYDFRQQRWEHEPYREPLVEISHLDDKQRQAYSDRRPGELTS